MFDSDIDIQEAMRRADVIWRDDFAERKRIVISRNAEEPLTDSEISYICDNLNRTFPDLRNICHLEFRVSG